MIVLGIHGLRGSGKDTLAAELAKRIHGARTIALGDRLKEVCALLFDVPIHNFYDQELKETAQFPHGTPREIMVAFDEAVVPKFGQNVFLNAISHIIEAQKYSLPCLIITDVRGEHEASFLRSRGGRIIHIQRPDMPVKPVINHWSEQGIKIEHRDFMYTIREGMHHVHNAADDIVKRLNKS